MSEARIHLIRALNHRTLRRNHAGVEHPPGYFLESKAERERREKADMNHRSQRLWESAA